MLDTNTLLERAELLLEQSRPSDAEKTVRQVLEQEPQNDEALALLTRCYYSAKRYSEGIETIQDAISLDPANSFYFYLLAFGYYRLDRNQDALENIHRAISLGPYHAEYYGLLSYMLLDSREFELALDKANEGLEVDPENLSCLNARSVALNKLKRTKEAIATMQNALAQDPDNEMTHTTVGWNLLEKGQHRDAENHFLEALRIDPNYGHAQLGMKEAMKSNLPPYKWMLQYSFWLHNKGRGFQRAMPFVFYILFRVLVGVFKSNENTAWLAWLVGGLYILFVVTSWTINSIANFCLLFHPRGKYALTLSERWSAITAVSALALGIAFLSLGAFTSIGVNTDYADLFIPGMILVSLALPLSLVEYPVSFSQTTGREKLTLGLAALGIVTLLAYVVAPASVFPLFAFYGLAFIVYTWTGA